MKRIVCPNGLITVNGSVLTFDTDRTPKQLPDWDFEALEQARRGLLLRLPAAYESVFAAFEEQHLPRAGFGVTQTASLPVVRS